MWNECMWLWGSWFYHQDFKFIVVVSQVSQIVNTFQSGIYGFISHWDKMDAHAPATIVGDVDVADAAPTCSPNTEASDGTRNFKLWRQYSYTWMLKILFQQKKHTF